MRDTVPASLDGFFDAAAPPARSLLLVNRTHPSQVQRLFERTFEGQSVSVGDLDLPDSADDLVLLVEDGDVVASSPLEAVMNSILLVNSDLYRHGTSGIDGHEVPDVVTNLDETEFRLRGYPASNKEKLLLIVVSRYIERRALTAGRGTIRSTFQRLSRIDDERGTKRVYERLGATDLSVHVYGRPDWTPDVPGVEVHAGTSEDYRRSWCVVFRPPEDDPEAGDPPASASGHAALVALETAPNVWRGMWTYRPALVDRIDAYLAEVF